MLLTWSDRGAGPPVSRGSRPAGDRGPVMRLLSLPESRERYDRARVLTTEAGFEVARGLVEEMRRVIPDVALSALAIPDPSDHEQVFHALEPVTASLRGDSDIDVLLSAGTPQMQTLWVILVQAGILSAGMLQVIPAAFVPDPHPRAIRPVHLDIAGFPEIRAMRAELVRLRAEVLRWTALCDDQVDVADLADEIRESARTASAVAGNLGPEVPPGTPGADPTAIPTLAQAVDRAENAVILRAVAASDHNLSRAARLLAIDRNTLKRKLDRFGISRGPGRPGRPRSRPPDRLPET